ncbi:unnamed protein product, partial [marine sediment metagenome]
YFKSISGVVIYNETGDDQLIGAANYTIVNNVLNPSTTELSVSILPDVDGGETYKSVWLISGTAQPLGYIAESGGRSIAGLIIIFAALAVMMVALIPSLRSKIFNF